MESFVSVCPLRVKKRVRLRWWIICSIFPSLKCLLWEKGKRTNDRAVTSNTARTEFTASLFEREKESGKKSKFNVCRFALYGMSRIQIGSIHVHALSGDVKIQIHSGRANQRTITKHRGLHGSSVNLSCPMIIDIFLLSPLLFYNEIQLLLRSRGYRSAGRGEGKYRLNPQRRMG